MIHTEVIAKDRLAIHRTESQFGMPNVVEAMQSLFTHPEFEADFSIIWDLRNSEINISIAEILNLDPAIVQLANEARPRGKTAWIMATAFGESIMQLLYSQYDWAAEWRTFSKIDAAVFWCRTSENK